MPSSFVPRSRPLRPNLHSPWCLSALTSLRLRDILIAQLHRALCKEGTPSPRPRHPLFQGLIGQALVLVLVLVPVASLDVLFTESTSPRQCIHPVLLRPHVFSGHINVLFIESTLPSGILLRFYCLLHRPQADRGFCSSAFVPKSRLSFRPWNTVLNTVPGCIPRPLFSALRLPYGSLFSLPSFLLSFLPSSLFLRLHSLRLH